jgi:uncharacterized membrane protein
MVFVSVLVIPLWALALLYQIKDAQKRLASELVKLMVAKAQMEKGHGAAVLPARDDSRKEPVSSAVASAHRASAQMPADLKKESVPVPDLKTTSSADTAATASLKTVEKAQPTVPAKEIFARQADGFREKKTAAAFPPHKQSEFERNVQEILSKMWTWIVVGEEYRPRNVSLEYAVASVWLMRSAIIIILTGIGFFLKYSMEKNIIGPYGRIAVGITVGLGMLIIGIKLANKKYHIIAQGLIGGGIATLYLSIFAAYKIYKVIPDARLSFALMILITIAASVIAVRLNSMLVAVFGIVGGYCTPIMLSVGTADLPGLFSYVLILGIAVICVAKYKDWKILNALSFVFTYGLYWGAMDKFYTDSDFIVAIVFISLFFLLFAAIPIMNNIIHKQKSNTLTLIGMFFNAAVFFTSAFYIIDGRFDREWVAVASLALALFYTIQAVVFVRRGISDRNLLVLLTGFASFFLTVTIPLVLSDKWITTAWSIQALVFLWMSCRMKSNFIRAVSYVLYFLAFARLFAFDFQKNCIFVKNLDYTNEMLMRLMTFGSFIASVALGYRLLKPEREDGAGIISRDNDTKEFITVNSSSAIFAGLTALLLFIYLHFEFYYISKYFYPPCLMPLMTLIWIAAIIIASAACVKGAGNFFLKIAVILSFGLIFKIFIFDMFFWRLSVGHFWFPVSYYIEESSMRALDFLMIIGAFAYSFFLLGGKTKDTARFFGVLTLSMLFIYFTLELNTFLNYKTPQFRAGGLSILWGLFGLAFVLGGIRKNITAVRYAGLLLFTVVVLKVFFSDLGRLSQLSRIIAFISLGLVVLAGSFIYVRFKDSFRIGPKQEEAKKNEED